MLTVVIPLYNKAPYIRRTIESALNQTFSDFELLVVDDGSTDGGAEIVEKISDKRIRVIRQENQGPGAARNRGIAESKHDFIAFLDADDEWLPKFLETCIDTLKVEPDCALVVTGYYEGQERIDMALEMRKQDVVAEGAWAVTRNTLAKELRIAIDSSLTPTVLVRKDIIESYGGFYSKNCCTYGEDTYLWLQIFLNHAIYRILDPLVWYHSESSELGIGRKSTPPLKPILTDSAVLYKSCPQEYVKLLDRCLSCYALKAACQQARTGNTKVANKLLKDFPAVNTLGWDHVRARIYISLMPLFRVLATSPIFLRWFRKIRNFMTFRRS